RRYFPRAPRIEVREIRRQVESPVCGHQVLDTVEIAAEGEVVHALMAATALPVQIDGYDAGVFLPAYGEMRDGAYPCFSKQIRLYIAHAKRDILRFDTPFRDHIAS